MKKITKQHRFLSHLGHTITDISRVAMLLSAFAMPAFASAVPQAQSSGKATAKTSPKTTPKTPPKKPLAPPIPPVEAPKTPQTVIYALGASLYFQDLDGSPPREEKIPLTEEESGKIEYLSASRDGQTLAFSVGEAIYFYDTKGKALSPVVPQDGERYLYPSISPDGQSVSCRPYRADATLCILSRNGEVRDLGPSTKEASKSRFTPDGKTIYFANGPDLLRIAIQGGQAQRVVRGNYIEDFSISAKGLIVAPVADGNTTVKPALVRGVEEITRLPFSSNDFNNPTWSPGGSSVAYSLRKRYGGDSNAQGVYIWKNIEMQTQTQTRKVSDAQSNGESGFVWR